jgi:LuxR family maltose regulon positive regulatory protein
VWKYTEKQEMIVREQEKWEQICREKKYDWLIQNQGSESVHSLTVTENRMEQISIFTLGKFKISKGQQLITIKRKLSIQLLQYFIIHRGKKLTKDNLIEAVFPESSIESANNYFAVALSHLRRTLEPGLKNGRDSMVITQSGEHYILKQDHIDLDIDRFMQLTSRNLESSSADRIHRLKQAELLYGGDFFEEYPYESFLENEREKLRVRYLQVLYELAEYYWNLDYQQGMYYFEKSLEKDPYQENVYLVYIQRLLQLNLALHAKKISDQYRKYIEKELGIPIQSKLDELFHNG